MLVLWLPAAATMELCVVFFVCVCVCVIMETQRPGDTFSSQVHHRGGFV